MEATLGMDEAGRREWGVVVIGAGPAGAMAAYRAAGAGAAVLLVDKAAFPRSKVCGCCVNAGALGLLGAAGLGDVVDGCGGRRLDRVRLWAGRRAAEVALPRGAAVSRRSLDAALVARAVEAGAEFLPETVAGVARADVDGRAVRLRRAGRSVTVHARVVIGAAGLGGRALEGEPGFAVSVSPASRMGAGVVVERDRAPAGYDAGTIHMACGRGGYVGLVRLAEGGLDVAGAFDPGFVRSSGGPGGAAAAVLGEAGLGRIERLEESAWRGTPRLTRRPGRVAGERLLVVGDAAGYVEPFTGEGIGWALASGWAAAGIAAEAASVRRWDGRHAARWSGLHGRMLRDRQRACHVVTRLLRRPRLARWAVRVLGVMPSLAGPVVRSINVPLIGG